MTLRQEKGVFSPGKKCKPHAGRLGQEEGLGLREPALSSEAELKSISASGLQTRLSAALRAGVIPVRERLPVGFENN